LEIPLIALAPHDPAAHGPSGGSAKAIPAYSERALDYGSIGAALVITVGSKELEALSRAGVGDRQFTKSPILREEPLQLAGRESLRARHFDPATL